MCLFLVVVGRHNGSEIGESRWDPAISPWIFCDHFSAPLELVACSIHEVYQPLPTCKALQ
jgi:hypothetical protein